MIFIGVRVRGTILIRLDYLVIIILNPYEDCQYENSREETMVLCWANQGQGSTGRGCDMAGA